MKVIGMIGGMSWESTATYYRLINQEVKARLGGHHSAKIVLYSVDFAEIEKLQQADRWDEAGRLLADAARAVERAGAECIVLCTNTMHEVAPTIEAAASIPLLHIADATGVAVRNAGIGTVALLGTRFTMERAFYTGRLSERYSLRVVVPNAQDRDEVHRAIYAELVHGIVREESRAHYLAIVARLRKQGAQGVILGCTEIGMLLPPGSLDLPSFDTATLHAMQAVDFALG
jgi:aspartate racemase